MPYELDGMDEYMSTPGERGLISPPLGLIPPFEKSATFELLSTAPMPIILGQFAGLPTALIIPRRRTLSLPAAAIMSVPARKARAPIRSYAIMGGVPGRTADPNDMDMT